MTDRTAAYLFHEGSNFSSYDYLGAHKREDGYVFRVFAPRADRIFLTGDFNDWGDNIPLRKITADGIWETVVYGNRIRIGDRYKYKIHSCGRVVYKADPYAREAGRTPESASVIPSESGHVWRDGGWLEYRRLAKSEIAKRPLNVYELHLGSFMHKEDGGVLSYSELARELAPYVKQMGYTHVQLLPLAEYCDDASAGYSPCCFFAPTSRYGGAEELCEFVDSMHEAGIGVILEWVPMRFSMDEHGLAAFDGEALYEREERAEGCAAFDLGRAEVRSFLISSADHWLRRFHIDGLFVAIEPYEAEREESKEFLRRLNSHLKSEFADVLSIVEDTGAYLRATGFEDGGLGFDMKWNIGWMSDTLAYASISHDARRTEQSRARLAYPQTYAFDESFVLPLPHKEVRSPKCSFLDKMPGDYWQKFAGARAFMGYAMTFPGKKLNFMGEEIGQFREWEQDTANEWFLLEYEMHAKLQRYRAELNHFYLSHSELWELDSSADGFFRISDGEREKSVLSYLRTDASGNELLVVVNFTPSTYTDFFIGVKQSGAYRELFNSDEEKFGGSGVVNKDLIQSTGVALVGYPDSVKIRVAPLSLTVIAKDGDADGRENK